MRHPDRPSIPLEPRDPPHPNPSATAHPGKLGRLFFVGVCGAVVGAILMVVGTASKSSATVWVAVVALILAASAIRADLKSGKSPLFIRR